MRRSRSGASPTSAGSTSTLSSLTRDYGAIRGWPVASDRRTVPDVHTESESRIERAVPYGQGKLLDIYRPGPAGAGPAPTVLLWHGVGRMSATCWRRSLSRRLATG